MEFEVPEIPNLEFNKQEKLEEHFKMLKRLNLDLEGWKMELT